MEKLYINIFKSFQRFSSSDIPTSVYHRSERDSLLCSLTLSTYPRKVTLPSTVVTYFVSCRAHISGVPVHTTEYTPIRWLIRVLILSYLWCTILAENSTVTGENTLQSAVNVMQSDLQALKSQLTNISQPQIMKTDSFTARNTNTPHIRPQYERSLRFSECLVGDRWYQQRGGFDPK
jgi:hypothetical protein